MATARGSALRHPKRPSPPRVAPSLLCSARTYSIPSIIIIITAAIRAPPTFVFKSKPVTSLHNLPPPAPLSRYRHSVVVLSYRKGQCVAAITILHHRRALASNFMERRGEPSFDRHPPSVLFFWLPFTVSPDYSGLFHDRVSLLAMRAASSAQIFGGVLKRQWRDHNILRAVPSFVHRMPIRHVPFSRVAY
jgi:hypothetical protein